MFGRFVLLGAGFGPAPPGTTFTAMGWPIEPDGLYEQLLIFRDRYGNPPVYVTENGAGYDDQPPANAEVPDLHRLEYIRACLRELRRGIADGAPVRGYFLWSLLDNFEWADGYSRRFGIVYNDFATQRRTPKMSAKWYSRVIGGNRLL